MTPRHPDCPFKHIGEGDKCPHCRRLYAKDKAKSETLAGASDARRKADRIAAAVDVQRSERPESVSALGVTKNDVRAKAGKSSSASPPPLSPAQKQRAYRERKKATDPDYLKREAARKRRERQEGKA